MEHIANRYSSIKLWLIFLFVSKKFLIFHVLMTHVLEASVIGTMRNGNVVERRGRR